MKPGTNKNSNFWRKARTPVLFFVVNALLISIVLWQYQHILNRKNSGIQLRGEDSLPESSKMAQVLNHDYSLINPLRLEDVPTEFSGYRNMKNSISLYIQSRKDMGIVSDAAVYFRKMNDGSWMSLSGNNAFKAGSLIKVPFLICYLKQVEENKLSLKQKFRYDTPQGVMPLQTFQGKTIQAGQSYSLEELLYYMIVESDNNATYVLGKNMEVSALQKVFSDLGLNKPQLSDMNYSINAIDYSKFFRVLYNASYLKEEYSSYALQLLTQCKFKSGMVKGLSPSTLVAHKFGEQKRDDESELSESGIVYNGNNTYLLTVMTRGKNIQELPEVISEISRQTFDAMKE